MYLSQLREEREQADFDGDRYLGDLCGASEDPLYEEAMQMNAFWEQSDGCQDAMNDEEREEMNGLKNREFLIYDERPIMLGLVDLLLAFAYDHRTTSGEPTVSTALSHALHFTACLLSSSVSFVFCCSHKTGGVILDNHHNEPISLLAGDVCPVERS